MLTDPSSDQWIKFHGHMNPRRFTRTSPILIFDNDNGQPVSSIPTTALPATTHLDHTGVLSAVPGPPKPSRGSSQPSGVTVSQILHKHRYFQQLFPPSAIPSEEDTAALVQEFPLGISVVIRSFLDNQEVLHGWVVFSTSSSSRLTSGIVSRATTTGEYSETRSLTECLVQIIYLLRVVLQVHQVSGCNVSLFCSSKSTVQLLHSVQNRNVSSSLDDDGDLIAELQYQWRRFTKHSTMQSFYCDLTSTKGNAKAKQHLERLGSDFNSFREGTDYTAQSVEYINPPHNEVQISYGGYPLLQKIRSTIRRDLYLPLIQATICKQEGWTTAQFHHIDWSAHEYAFLKTWSSKRITYTKLAHKLINTNVQSKKYYGKSDICPCCGILPETFKHVFTCSSRDVTDFRRKQQEILWKQFDLIDTPDEIVHAIQMGILSLESSSVTQPPSTSCKPAFDDQTALVGRLCFGVELVSYGSPRLLEVTSPIKLPRDGLEI